MGINCFQSFEDIASVSKKRIETLRRVFVGDCGKEMFDKYLILFGPIGKGLQTRIKDHRAVSCSEAIRPFNVSKPALNFLNNMFGSHLFPLIIDAISNLLNLNI